MFPGQKPYGDIEQKAKILHQGEYMQEEDIKEQRVSRGRRKDGLDNSETYR